MVRPAADLAVIAPDSLYSWRYAIPENTSSLLAVLKSPSFHDQIRTASPRTGAPSDLRRPFDLPGLVQNVLLFD